MKQTELKTRLLHDPLPEKKRLLSQLSAAQVDRLLGILIELLGIDDEECQRIVLNKLMHHPLFNFRTRDHNKNFVSRMERIYFPARQIQDCRSALLKVYAHISPEYREQLIINLAHLDGLSTLIPPHELFKQNGDQALYELYRNKRVWYQYPPQVTAVLNYKCQKKCFYCFTDALQTQIDGFLSFHNLNQIIKWALQNGAYYLSITGGEPTLHPEFSQIITKISDENLYTYFSSNMLGPKQAYQSLGDKKVASITLHILDDDAYQNGEIQLLKSNLKIIKHLGIKLILRYVVHGKSINNCSILFDTFETIKPDSVSLSTIFPGPLRRDLSCDIQEMFKLKDVLLSFINAFHSKKAHIVLAKPVPLCIFTPAELIDVAAMVQIKNICEIDHNNFTNNLMVNPDLTVFPCMALAFFDKKLSHFHTMNEVGQWAQKKIMSLIQNPMLEKCTTCQLWQLNICQPACLSFLQP